MTITNRSHIIIHSKNIIEKLKYTDILYMTSSGHYVEIQTSGNERKTTRDTLKNIIQSLPPTFVQCHRTIIINLCYLDKIENNSAFLSNGDILPISRNFLKSVKAEFTRYLG